MKKSMHATKIAGLMAQAVMKKHMKKGEECSTEEEASESMKEAKAEGDKPKKAPGKK